jgi:hypothetical protein
MMGTIRKVAATAIQLEPTPPVVPADSPAAGQRTTPQQPR